MDKELIINSVECYKLAEEKAAHYFESLYREVSQKRYIPTLIKDIESWKQDHVHGYSWLSSFVSRQSKRDSKDYYYYIRWLNSRGRLDSYLDRSISYIFMRDLGKALDSPETQSKIRRIVDGLKDDLTSSRSSRSENKVEMFSLAELYRKAEKEGIQPTFLWLTNKLKTVSSHIPNEMDAEHAKRKLIKIIAGVLLHVFEEMNDDISPEERKRKLDEAIRLGYSYGLTYPFIDDLLDAKILSPEEERQYSNVIRTALLTGNVPPLGEWQGKHMEFIHYVHSELKEAFQYIKAHQRQETLTSFFEQAYVFFHSQETDREKNLAYEHYSNEELYIPVIIKSSSSRSIIRSVLNASIDEGFDRRTFFYGIYNQLADDFTDMFDDWQEGAVTPYTYYMKHHKAVKGKILTLEQLNEMSFYKTGLAFEASLVMPAILAHTKETEIESLKKFAYHAGIAFQIKDDLLDVEGELNVLGKPIGQDIENHHSTFVTVLGKEEAEKALWERYCLAVEVLQGISDYPPFLKHLLNYMVNRDH